MKRVLAAIVIATVAIHAPANVKRSAAAVAAFQRENPCPSNGQRRGACPDHQVDHITPLCASGEDHPRNMQWIKVEDHRFKTLVDVRECRKSKKAHTPKKEENDARQD
jgi:hypothetical protein